MEESAAVGALGALAQPMRLRLFRALIGAAPAGLTPGALCAMLDVPASTLSFHLKELSHAGLVDVERQGRQLHYRPVLAQMNELIDYLTAHCCQGSLGPARTDAPATSCGTAAVCCAPAATSVPAAARAARKTLSRRPR